LEFRRQLGRTEQVNIVIYIIAGISILLAIGGLSAYSDSRHPGFVISSIISIVFSGLAIYLVHWWPLLIGFAGNWGLRLLGLDPGYKK
jgi:hypothetical protein